MAESNVSELENQLVLFREHWQEEIESERQVNQKGNENGGALTVEEHATQLLYRQAVHLVPDIEFKIAELKQPVRGFSGSKQPGSGFSGSSTDPDGDIEQQRRCEDSLQDDTSFDVVNTEGLCSPCTPQITTHISSLPTELLSLLFKWVVSKDLDVESLSHSSLVCKWFYVCARDEEIWKQICLRVWGISCDIALYDNCWRQMFLQRPRVKFDGIYISTNSYIHFGAPSAGSYYKPCHIVEYYKYLRFFSDGTVLVYTSTEDPQSVMQLLRHPPYGDRSVHKGYYRLSESDMVNVYYTSVVKPRNECSRRRRNREKSEIREHHFFMNLTLTSNARRRNCELLWDMYTYQIKNRKSGEISENPISFSSFKPFVFSGVQSYLSQSVNSI